MAEAVAIIGPGTSVELASELARPDETDETVDGLVGVDPITLDDGIGRSAPATAVS